MTDAEKLTRVVGVLAAIHGEFAAAVRAYDDDGTGMRVPYHGDFQPTAMAPSIRSRIRWWERRMRSVLDEIGVANG